MESGTEGPGGPRRFELKPKPVWIQKYFPPGEIERIKQHALLEPEKAIARRRQEVKGVIDEALHRLAESGSSERELRELVYDMSVLLDPDKKLTSEQCAINAKNTEALDWLDREFRLDFGILTTSTGE